MTIATTEPNTTEADCNECGNEVAIGSGLVLIEETWWVGKTNATVYCTQTCMDDASESAGMAQFERNLVMKYSW